MRPWWALGFVLLAAIPVNAQSATPLGRGDLQAAVGWQNLRTEPTSYGDRWMNGIALVDGAAGWYWTDHLRTQLDAGIGTEGRYYGTTQVGGALPGAFDTVETLVRPVTFAVSQQYQFFRNAYFHPHLGAGLLVRRERVVERHQLYSPYEANRIQGYTTDFTRTRTAAVLDAGFKAYWSQRGFFVTDARLTLRSGIEGLLLRFGFGVDL